MHSGAFLALFQRGGVAGGSSLMELKFSLNSHISLVKEHLILYVSAWGHQEGLLWLSQQNRDTASSVDSSVLASCSFNCLQLL